MHKKTKLFTVLASLITVSCLSGCDNGGNENGGNKGPDLSKEITTPITVDSAYKRFDIDKKADNPLVGFGAQMDTDIFMPWNNMSPEDEAIWEKRIKEMNIKYTRIKYYPEFCERDNDNDDPNVFDYNSPNVEMNCVEMQALYKVLDLCEKYSIKVDFSIYGCYNTFKSYDGKVIGSWLADNSDEVKNEWAIAPKDYDEYAENVVMVVKYLMDVKHYNCIWGISNISEMFIDKNHAKSWDAFVECSRKIDAKMKKEGIRDKVKLFGSSEAANSTKYYREEFESVKDIFDVCATGNYNWDYQCDNDSIYNYFEEQIETMKYYGKKDYAISEFCQGKHFIDAVNKTDIDDYSAGLYIARFCIEASKAGVTAFDHYILGDTFFTNSYVHTMGLWMYRDSNVAHPGYISWAAHPEYYFYTMMSRYTDRGAYCYQFKEELASQYADPDGDLSVCAFKLADGKWTYFLANKGTSQKKVALVNPQGGRPGAMSCYKITESAIPADRNCDMIGSFKSVDASNGVCYVTVPANGMLTVSDRF